MYVCMYVCMYVYQYIHTYDIYTHVRYDSSFFNTNNKIKCIISVIHVSKYVCMYVCMNVCQYICTCPV